MNPYETVVSRFGTVSKLAAALNVNHTTVLQWKKRGLIPSHHMLNILKAAEQRGIKLDPLEIIAGETEGDSVPKEEIKLKIAA